MERAVADLSRLPPIVTSWEIDALKDQIARAQRGEAFVLQGGDCAENFSDCTSESIVAKLKILLQMSLVMLYGLKKTGCPGGAYGGAIRQAALLLTFETRGRRNPCRVFAETWSTATRSPLRIVYRTRNWYCVATKGRR